MIDAHLTSLEAKDGKVWVPIIDYADLLKKPSEEEWQAMESIYTELRNLGKRHGVPTITATQSNAGGFKADKPGGQHLAGSTRKAFIVDYMFAINQSDDEYAVGRFTLDSLFVRHGKKNEVTYWRAFYGTGAVQQCTQAVWAQLALPQTT